MALDKIRTELIADDAVTAAKIPAGAVGTTEIAEGALSVHALQNTTSHTLSGTYTDSKMYTSDAYVLGGNITVNANLVLSSVKGDGSDITLTDDGTTRTITGTGKLEAGAILAKVNTDASQLSGALSSAVTGSPAITGLGTVTSGTLASGVFPSGHILQVQSTHKTDTWSSYHTSQPNGRDVPGLAVDITPTSPLSKILIMVQINVSTESKDQGIMIWVNRNGEIDDDYIGNAGEQRSRVITGSENWGPTSNAEIDRRLIQMTGNYISTPSSASVQTYQVVLRAELNNTWYNVNVTGTSPNNYDHPRGASSIIAMEIQG